jgi:hypothetical protein
VPAGIVIRATCAPAPALARKRVTIKARFMQHLRQLEALYNITNGSPGEKSEARGKWRARRRVEESE